MYFKTCYWSTSIIKIYLWSPSYCMLQRIRMWKYLIVSKLCYWIEGLTHFLEACSPLPNNIKIQMTEVWTSPKLTLPSVSIKQLKTLLVLGNIVWTFYTSHHLKRSLWTAQDRNTFDRCSFGIEVTDPYNVQSCHVNSSSAFWC